MKLSLTGDKVQLIYVNPNDTYYGEDLLELDINKNLWFQLHELDFECVYFLSSYQSGILISDMGDKSRIEFAKSNILGKLHVSRDPNAKKENTPSVKEFRDVVLPHWNAQKSAIVISMDTLMKVAKSGDWADAFSRFAAGKDGNAVLFILVSKDNEKGIRAKGIFNIFQGTSIYNILEPYGEKSSDSFRDILSNNHARNCNFMDQMGKGDIRNILINLMMKDPNKFEDIDNLENMVTYLRIILDTEAPLDRNLVLKNKVHNRKDCYIHHMNIDNWNRMKQFCVRVGYDKVFDATFSPELLGHSMYNGESIGDIISDIKELLKLKKENDQTYRIQFCILDIIQEWDLYSKDYETIGLVFTAIRTYLRFLNVEEIGIENMRTLFSWLEQYKAVFQLSKRVYTNEANIEAYGNNPSSLTAKLISQQQMQIVADKQMIENNMDALNVMALQIMNKAMEVKVDLVKTVTDTIGELENNTESAVDHEILMRSISNSKIVTAPEEKVEEEKQELQQFNGDSVPSGAVPSEEPTPQTVNLDEYDFDINDIDAMY